MPAMWGWIFSAHFMILSPAIALLPSFVDSYPNETLHIYPRTRM